MIVLDNIEILYFVKRWTKKNIKISFLKNGDMNIFIPLFFSEKKLFYLLEEKKKWILKTHIHYKKQAQSKKEVENKIPFLGVYYDYSVQQATVNKLLLENHHFYFFQKDFLNQEDKHKILEKFYRNTCVSIFEERLQVCFSQFIKVYPCPKPFLKIRKMKRRFGSMDTKRQLTLNSKVVQLPIYLIDFIIFHELCHIKYLHHQKPFYDLLSIFISNHKEYYKKVTQFHYYE